MRLKQLREEAGLTQSELASSVELNKVTYRFYENEQRQPPFEVVFRLADRLNVTTDYLMGYSDFNYKTLAK